MVIFDQSNGGIIGGVEIRLRSLAQWQLSTECRVYVKVVYNLWPELWRSCG